MRLWGFPVLIVAKSAGDGSCESLQSINQKVFAFPPVVPRHPGFPAPSRRTPGQAAKKGAGVFSPVPFFIQAAVPPMALFPCCMIIKTTAGALRHNRAECGISRQYGKFAHKSGPLFKGAVDEPSCKKVQREICKSSAAAMPPPQNETPSIGNRGRFILWQHDCADRPKRSYGASRTAGAGSRPAKSRFSP